MPKPSGLPRPQQLLTRPQQARHLPHTHSPAFSGASLSNTRHVSPNPNYPGSLSSTLKQQIRTHFVAVMNITSGPTATAPAGPTPAGAGYAGAVRPAGGVGTTLGWGPTSASSSNSASYNATTTTATTHSQTHTQSGENAIGRSSGVNAAGLGHGRGGAAGVSHPGPSAESRYGFAMSPRPPNPLGEGRCIRTAAALVIGDEILNGKTLEKNSHYFARYCFDLGIDLKRIEVVSDDEQEIIEASRRMVAHYDFVITTGGIGPTHDDITYASLAKAFNQNLVHHPETLRRMSEMNKNRAWVASQDSQQKEATKRMALFPDKAEVLFVGRDLWVPVVRLEGKLCIFPGIPALFQKMLNGLTDYLPLPPECDRPKRIQIFTERPESMIAPYLTTLQARLKPHDIQVGSYPVLGKGVFVSLIGKRKHSYPNSYSNTDGSLRICLSEISAEVEREIGGRVVSEEEVAKKKDEARRSDPSGVAAATITTSTHVPQSGSQSQGTEASKVRI